MISLELLAYAAFVLILVIAFSFLPSVPSLLDESCALRGDAASVLGYLSVNLGGCDFDGNAVGDVPLFGYVRTTSVVQVIVLRDYP